MALGFDLMAATGDDESPTCSSDPYYAIHHCALKIRKRKQEKARSLEYQLLI